jgi:hypothetical protein
VPVLALAFFDKRASNSKASALVFINHRVADIQSE